MVKHGQKAWAREGGGLRVGGGEIHFRQKLLAIC